MIALRLGRLDVQITDRVMLAGRLDDSVALGELVPKVPPGDVVIDAGGVTFVNSIGMREWIRFVRALRDRGSRITVERVAEVLMAQLNMVGEMAHAITVSSFHAPYLCPACGGEHAPLVDARANAQALRRLEAPRLPCPECGAAMDLSDFPERYLSMFKP